MIKKDINQNDILNLELLNILDYNYIYSDKPIKRIEANSASKNPLLKLELLKKKIESIQDCDLKKYASKIIFGDGNLQSSIMLIGDGPNQEEDKLGKPFMGEVGNLLKKMLKAIKIERQKIYITNVINYRLPNNRKLQYSEVNRYSEYLKEHIAIIDPKILILMGSTAMEAILGSKKNISKERGKWGKVIIGKKSYKVITTFHPAYLLRKPDQKKFSWEDLQIIRKEIDDQKMII